MMTPAATRHAARQRLYDALKRVRALPDGATLDVRLHGETLRLARRDPGALADYEHVVYVHRGRIGHGWSYRGTRQVMSATGGRLVAPSKILATVVDVVTANSRAEPVAPAPARAPVG